MYFTIPQKRLLHEARSNEALAAMIKTYIDAAKVNRSFYLDKSQLPREPKDDMVAVSNIYFNLIGKDLNNMSSEELDAEEEGFRAKEGLKVKEETVSSTCDEHPDGMMGCERCEQAQRNWYDIKAREHLQHKSPPSKRHKQKWFRRLFGS